jgi:3-hydroxybutyryl-CoA dehydratase
VKPPVAALTGTRPATREIGPLTQTDIVRFAGAGGDFNPLHHDPAAASAAGFDGPIAMGQLTAGLLAAWLTDWCGVEHLRELSVRFTAPVRIGDTVLLSGEVGGIEPQSDGTGLAAMTLAATCSGAPVVTGSASVVVRGR